MDAKSIADKYIGPRGGKPKKARAARPAKKKTTSRDDVTLPKSDYQMLLEAAGVASDFTVCEACGAWMFEYEDGVHLGDVVSCDYYAYDNDERSKNTCRRYRAALTS
ncbi:MAG: hypothetical protein RIC14_00640 [Filomicrobium sp.]